MSLRAFREARLLPVILVAAIVIVLPLFFPSAYYYRIGALVFIFALAVVGLNLLMGFAGQVSLGHAGFLGIGAYAVAIGPTYFALPAWFSLIIGAVLSGIVAFLVGRPILKLKGHYLAVAAIIVVLLWMFMERTLLGKAVTATAANRLAARLIGINTRRIVDFSFAISAAIGAVAGIVVTPITLTSYDVGTLLALKGFAAAMLGGIGSAPGAVIGGVLLGLIEALTAGYISSNYKDAVAFLIILIVLVAMPQGLFGRARIERV